MIRPIRLPIRLQVQPIQPIRVIEEQAPCDVDGLAFRELVLADAVGEGIVQCLAALHGAEVERLGPVVSVRCNVIYPSASNDNMVTQ
jgi:hypothetical protein